MLGICVPSSLQTRPALCSRLTCGAERSLSASGCMEVGQWQGSRAREQSTECMRGLLLLEEVMYSCKSKNRCLSSCSSEQRSHLLAEFLAKAQFLVVGFLAAACLYH